MFFIEPLINSIIPLPDRKEETLPLDKDMDIIVSCMEFIFIRSLFSRMSEYKNVLGRICHFRWHVQVYFTYRTLMGVTNLVFQVVPGLGWIPRDCLLAAKCK